MKLMACAVVATSMLASAAHAGEWRLLKADQAKAFLVDTSTVRSIPHTQKKVAWGAQLLPAANQKGEDYYVIQYEFDCVAMTVADLSFNAYTEKGGILSSENTPTRPIPVIPDSVGHSMFRAVCDGSDANYFNTVMEAIDVYRTVLAKN